LIRKKRADGMDKDPPGVSVQKAWNRYVNMLLPSSPKACIIELFCLSPSLLTYLIFIIFIPLQMLRHPTTIVQINTTGKFESS